MLEAGVVLARFLHYVSVLTLFGVSLFPLYTYPRHGGGLPARLKRLLRPTVSLAALVALLSGGLWFGCVVVDMTGTPGGVFDPDALWSVLSETSFGKVSATRLVLAAIILGLIARSRLITSSSHRLVAGLSAVLLASLAGVGHTQIHNGVIWIVHLSADGLHLLAAGAWLGGLLPLLYLVTTAVRTRSVEQQTEASSAALRFSGMGYVAVAMITGTGLLNGWLVVGNSIANLIATPYGRLLIVKLFLFATMLALAALNRFWLVPSLIKDNGQPGPTLQLSKLYGHILGEQALGLAIILIVSGIGTMDPTFSSQQQGICDRSNGFSFAAN